MTEFGVVPSGFNIKPLAVILAEIEQANITEFGPDVIQTPQSPLGQLNGLFADLATELWEIAQDVYQSYDPDQAEGSRLEVLGRLRLIRRAQDESDQTLRDLITNRSTARINLADVLRAVKGVPGVRYQRIFVNETREENDQGLPPNTVVIAVLGGDDVAVADVVNQYIIPGISTYGNTQVSILEEGYCRTINLLRPVEIETSVEVTVIARPDQLGCPPPSSNAIREALLEYLQNPDTRPWNGQAITPHYVRTYIERLFPNVEVLAVTGTKADSPVDEQGQGIRFEFMEIANVTEVTVVVA